MFQLDDFTIEDFDWKNRIPLHQSKLSDLYKVLNLKTGRFVAIQQHRVFLFSNQIHNLLQHKIDALPIVAGDCILQHLKTFTFPQITYVVFELCEVNLRKFYSDLNQSVAEEEIGRIAHCVAKGMVSIQEGNCVNGNLNPLNILKRESVWKLTNFMKFLKLSKRQRRSELFQEDEFRYLSPEALNQTLESEPDCMMSDVWSFGVILYELIYGHLPLDKNKELNYSGYSSAVKNSKISFAKVSSVSESLLKLVAHCLRKSPTSRLTWAMILNHQCLTPFRSQKIVQNPQQSNDVYSVLSTFQRLAVEKMGGQENVKRFCDGELSWNGIQMSNRNLRYDQFEGICESINPEISEVELRMLFNQVNISQDGLIDKKELTHLLTCDITKILTNFFNQLSTVLKRKGVDTSEIFEKHDKDHSGTLQAREIRQLTKSYLPNFSQSDLSIIIDYINKKFKGKIPISTIYQQCKLSSSADIERNTLNSATSQLQNLKSNIKQYQISVSQLVKKFDKNKNNKLDFGEFKRLVYSINQFVREKELRLMFDQIDIDQSGQITVKEMQTFFEC